MARPRSEPDEEREPGFWNIWWVLALISLVFTIGVAVAEYPGAFRDLGIVLSIAGIGITVMFGITASTRRTTELIRFDVRGVRRDLGRFSTSIAGPLDRIDRSLGRIEALLVRPLAAILRHRPRRGVHPPAAAECSKGLMMPLAATSQSPKNTNHARTPSGLTSP